MHKQTIVLYVKFTCSSVSYTQGNDLELVK